MIHQRNGNFDAVCSSCAGIRTISSLFPFDYALCPDCTACSLGFTPPMRLKLRSKLFLRSFPPSGVLLATSGRQAGRFPVDFSLQSALTLPENRLSLG